MTRYRRCCVLADGDRGRVGSGRRVSISWRGCAADLVKVRLVLDSDEPFGGRGHAGCTEVMRGRDVFPQPEISRERSERTRRRDRRFQGLHLASGAAVRGRREFRRRERNSRFHQPASGCGDVLCRAQRHGRRANGLSAGAGKPVAGRRQGCRGGDLLDPRKHRSVPGQSAGDRGHRLFRRGVPCGELSGAPGISGDAITALPGRCWCRAFTARTRMRARPKRPILATTPASTRRARRSRASFASRCRSCSRGRCSIRRV